MRDDALRGPAESPGSGKARNEGEGRDDGQGQREGDRLIGNDAVVVPSGVQGEGKVRLGLDEARDQAKGKMRDKITNTGGFRGQCFTQLPDHYHRKAISHLPYLCMWSTASCTPATTSKLIRRSPYSVLMFSAFSPTRPRDCARSPLGKNRRNTGYGRQRGEGQ